MIFTRWFGAAELAGAAGVDGAAGAAGGTALSTFCSAWPGWFDILRSENEMIYVHYWSKKRQSQEMKRLHFILICTTV
jgi:hypothetical protein